jgi:hypothetical protein
MIAGRFDSTLSTPSRERPMSAPIVAVASHGDLFPELFIATL